MIITTPFKNADSKKLPYAVLLRFQGETSSEDWDHMERWLLWQIGPGRSGDWDLIGEADHWYLGWHGTYPAIYFLEERALKRFMAFFDISSQFRLDPLHVRCNDGNNAEHRFSAERSYDPFGADADAREVRQEIRRETLQRCRKSLSDTERRILSDLIEGISLEELRARVPGGLRNSQLSTLADVLGRA